MTGLSEAELASIGRAADHAATACEAASFEVYDPREETSPDQHPDVPAAEVYATDRARISESDVLVCIADRPSFGVGQEVTIAQARVVPVVLVAYRDMPLSRMLTGSPGLTQVVRYDEPEDIAQPLTDVLDRLRADIVPSLRTARNEELRLIADALAARLAGQPSGHRRLVHSIAPDTEGAAPWSDRDLQTFNPSLAELLAICNELGEPLGGRILDLIEVAK